MIEFLMTVILVAIIIWACVKAYVLYQDVLTGPWIEK